MLMCHTQEITSVFSWLFFSMDAQCSICSMEQKVLVYFAVFEKTHILSTYVYIPYISALSFKLATFSFCYCLLWFFTLQRLCVFVILCSLWKNTCCSETSKVRHFQFFVADTVWPLPRKAKSDLAWTSGNH